MKNGRVAAETSGVRVSRHRLAAFGLAALLAALAGTLQLATQGAVSASSFDPTTSLFVVIAAVFSGIDTARGAVLGGLLAGDASQLPAEFSLQNNWTTLALGGLILVPLLGGGAPGGGQRFNV